MLLIRIIDMGGLDPMHRDQAVTVLSDHQATFATIIREVTPYPQSTILTGMVLGDGRKIPRVISEAFRNTSTIHLLVVSGQNLSLLAGFLLSFTPLFGRKKTVVMIFCVILYYSIVTGFQVPVVRAGIMASLAYGGILLGRMRHTWWTLLATAGLMLLYNPNWIMSISFQLSFLATFGVVVISPYFVALLSKIPDFIRQDLAVSLAAQLMTMPIIAYNFGQISLVGILANCLILWTTPLIMISGLIVMGVGLFSPFIAQILGLFPTVLITYVITIIDWCDSVPYASVMLDTTGQILWIGYYFCLVGAILWLRKLMIRLHTNKAYSEPQFDF
jgi:competence protein ComEC